MGCVPDLVRRALPASYVRRPEGRSTRAVLPTVIGGVEVVCQYISETLPREAMRCMSSLPIGVTRDHVA